VAPGKYVIQLNQIRSIMVETTSHCNLHCPQCARFDPEGYQNPALKLGHLDFNNFTKNLQLDQLTSLEKIEYIGDHGDIMMHPRARDFLDFVDGHVPILAVTNGSLRSKKFWHNLASVKNLRVWFSVDGLKDTNHIYRINADFDKIMENAQSFIDAGGHAEWKFIVFQHNQHQIEEARLLSEQMGFKSFQIQHTKRSWWQGNSWPVKIDGKYTHTIYPSDKAGDFTKLAHITTIEKFKKKTTTNPEPNCWLTRHDVYINFLGHVLPCCQTSAKTWQNDIESKMWLKLVGDINTIDINQNTLTQVFNSDFYQGRLRSSWEGKPFTHPTCVAYCG